MAALMRLGITTLLSCTARKSAIVLPFLVLVMRAPSWVLELVAEIRGVRTRACMIGHGCGLVLFLLDVLREIGCLHAGSNVLGTIRLRDAEGAVTFCRSMHRGVLRFADDHGYNSEPSGLKC